MNYLKQTLEGLQVLLFIIFVTLIVTLPFFLMSHYNNKNWGLLYLILGIPFLHSLGEKHINELDK